MKLFRKLLLSAVLLFSLAAFGATKFASPELGFTATFPGTDIVTQKGVDYTEMYGVELGKDSGYVAVVSLDLSKTTVDDAYMTGMLNEFTAAQEVTVEKSFVSGMKTTTDGKTYPVAVAMGTAVTEEHKTKLNVFVAFIAEKDKNREYYVMGMIAEGQDGTEAKQFISSFTIQ